MQFPIPGEVLRHARESAGIKQGALARSLESNASFVSRLEKGGPVDPAFAERYLQALNVDLSNEILSYYNREWSEIEPPSFLHPDREHLWRIGQTLQQLREFEASRHNHPILASTISAIREDLGDVFRYLERLDHIIAWVGDIGVGKTTALAYAAKLLIPDHKGQVRSIFPVGSGRVTVCETVIKTAPAFGVAVDPLAPEAIRAYVRELVSGVAGNKSNVPSEIGRLLRNMSGYLISRTLSGEEFNTVDPIFEALKAGEAEDALADKIISAMNLASRRETSLAISENTEDGMQWLARTISRINIGTDPRFSVPRRITVLVPSESLRDAGDLSIVDTKGVETITQRPDLRGYADDPRTLMVLCTKFPDAPNATVQRILRENEEMGSDATTRNRISILVLPRNEEPLQVLDRGEPPSSRAEGYAIRREEISQALSATGLPKVRVNFYDAHTEQADAIWVSLRGQLNAMRQVYVERLEGSAQAVQELIADVDLVKTRGARKRIEEDFALLCERIGTLPPCRRPFHQNLIDQFDVGHQSSVAASMARRGVWPNFSIPLMLGVGVRQDANLRSIEHISRIQHGFEDNQHRYGEISDVRALVGSLKERIAIWRQDFLAQAQVIGSDAFAPVLIDQKELWGELISRYGTGVPGYKRDLAAIWRKFFEGEKPELVKAAIEARLADAWRSIVVEPLLAVTRAADLDANA